MAEVEITVMEEVKDLKNEIKALRKELNKPNASKEELLTFEMLGRYQHIVNQQAWLWRWEHIDTLYKPVNCIPTWVVADSVMTVWASGKEDLPNSFMNWDSPEMVAIALNFFSRAGEMEADLESSEVPKFRNAINGMKDSIRDLIRRTSLAEESYEEAAAQFNNILASVSDELREFVEARGEEQRWEYIAKCMDCIRGIHGSLDGTQFILMMVTNATTHHALSLSARVNQSQIPLQIMILPMRTQAATMGARLKFVEFLSRQVLALDVKLGPTNAVSLESGGEGSGIVSIPGSRTSAAAKKPDLPKTPVTAHTSTKTDHTHGAPKAKTLDTPTKPKTPETSSKPKTPEMPSKPKTPETPSKPRMMLSPTASATLARFKGMSDDDKAPRKRRAESTSKEVPAKKAKVEVESDSYSSLTPAKSKAPKKVKKKTKKKAKSSGESSSSSEDERRKKPPKDKAEVIAWVNQDRASKWKKDIPHVVRYRQRKGLCAKELTGGPNNTRHVDLLTQLLHEGQLGLNITQLDARIEEVAEDSDRSKRAHRLLKVLQEVRSETMGRSGVYAEYVVKAFQAPHSQAVIQKGDNNHWDTSAMIGLYNIHKYEAVGKGNKKVDSKMVTKGYCPFCEYSAGNNGSINNHIQVHYHLVLKCGLSNCSTVLYDAERMVTHAKDKHKLETDG